MKNKYRFRSKVALYFILLAWHSSLLAEQLETNKPTAYKTAGPALSYTVSTNKHNNKLQLKNDIAFNILYPFIFGKYTIAPIFEYYDRAILASNNDFSTAPNMSLGILNAYELNEKISFFNTLNFLSGFKNILEHNYLSTKIGLVYNGYKNPSCFYSCGKWTLGGRARSFEKGTRFQFLPIIGYANKFGSNSKFYFSLLFPQDIYIGYEYSSKEQIEIGGLIDGGNFLAIQNDLKLIESQVGYAPFIRMRKKLFKIVYGEFTLGAIRWDFETRTLREDLPTSETSSKSDWSPYLQVKIRTML